MRDSIESLAKEEQELEEKIFGTPSSEETTDEEATTTEAGAEETPAEEEALVAPNPEPATDEQPKPQTENWELRYKNLRASRDENTYEAKAKLAEALKTINKLQDRIQKLEEAQPSVDPLEGAFTPEDTEQLGEQAVEAMKRVTQKATAAASARYDAEIKRLHEQQREQERKQAEAAQQDAYNTFLGRIERALPDWKDINFDPKFMEWCKELDVDGLPRSKHFARAEAQGNAALIIRYMQDYKASRTAKVSTDKLADKVTPVGNGVGSTQTGTQENKKISRAFVDKFYDDLSRGKYKGRHSEAMAIEAKIDAAAVRGDIVQ